MSDYTFNINFEERINELRQSAIGAPVELQIVWMAELLCICLLLKYRDSSRKIIKLDKAWRLTHKAAAVMVSDIGVSFQTAVDLFGFRDTFVHAGLIAAVPHQIQFLSRPQSELDILQKFTGVNLNQGRSLL